MRVWQQSSMALLGAAAAVALCMGAFSSRAHAAGLLISDGGWGGVLQIEEHSVNVTINNGIAVTEVTQVFRNTENRQVEALYTFPVPKGASVAGFSMWINGKEMIGEVLEKERARQIYNSYKQKRRDPGLLEQTSYKTFEMRIFPIGPRAQQKVMISYYQELDFDHDRATYVYPLATVTRRGVNHRVHGKFALNLEVRSQVPIIKMDSPSHGDEFVIVQHTEHYCQASLEAAGGNLDRDLVLAYQLSRPKTGIDLVTSHERGEDGYFFLTLTAGQELAGKSSSMDYVFILDISGSMAQGGKLRISRNSLAAFIAGLTPEDRFEIIAFNVSPTLLFSSLVPGTKESKTRGTEFLRSQKARGGTVLSPALQAAYRYLDSDRQLNIVILSDGMTEQTERRELLAMIQQRPANTRVFCVGVGNEVNRPLLQQMAQDAGGLAAFISRGDNFERVAQAFRRKLMHPVAENVQIRVDGVDTYDIEPRIIPNLYHGWPVRIYGRYRGSGPATVTLDADVNGGELKREFKLEFPRRNADNPEIERMWAWHRVQRLLKEADRTGSRQPVLDEIVRLGEDYSIASEYTSFLVLENDAEYRRWKIDRRNVLRMTRDRRSLRSTREQLAAIRSKALNNIGPVAVQPAPQASRTRASRTRAQAPTRIRRPVASRSPQTSRPSSRPVRRRVTSRRPSSGGGFGGGAIDPISGAIGLGLAGAALLAGRRRRNESESGSKKENEEGAA